MTLAESLATELEQEAATTRKVLERIPESEYDWQPHPKSFSMGSLASHTAEIGNWAVVTMTTEELDFDPAQFAPWKASSQAELLQKFGENMAKAAELIRAATPEQLEQIWKLKVLGETRLAMPKAACLRMWVLNHLIHHRGQLSVYLRLREIPVPSIYGPSADEQ